MIMGDIGVKTTEELLDHLRRRSKNIASRLPPEPLLAIRNQMKQGKDAYDFEKARPSSGHRRQRRRQDHLHRQAGCQLQESGQVSVASADTFRGPPMSSWRMGQKADVDIISGNEDPSASVVFDASTPPAVERQTCSLRYGRQAP